MVCSLIAQPAVAISSAVNLSTRMVVQTGDNVLIGGFIIYGSGQKRIAVRAIGPSLRIAGTLGDPLLELHDAAGNIVATNDNWRSAQEAEIIASGLAPANDLEAALIATLNTGPYTVVVKGVNILKRHSKAGRSVGGVKAIQGGIVDFEAPLAYSNVMLICLSCGKPTRVKHTVLENGRRALECRQCGEPYERVRTVEQQ